MVRASCQQPLEPISAGECCVSTWAHVGGPARRECSSQDEDALWPGLLAEWKEGWILFMLRAEYRQRSVVRAMRFLKSILSSRMESGDPAKGRDAVKGDRHPLRDVSLELPRFFGLLGGGGSRSQGVGEAL